MLRTNQFFLAYIAQLYNAQPRKEDIIVKTFAKGKRLFIQNENPSKVMLIKSGITKCFFTEGNDKEYIVEFLSTGELLGEIELVRNIPNLCNIEAITTVEVYAIAIPYFAERIEIDLKLNNLLLNVFAERIINTASRASFQQLYTVENSLAKLLELQSKQEIEISKEDMAAYLGITVRSLNRRLKSLTENECNS